MSRFPLLFEADKMPLFKPAIIKQYVTSQADRIKPAFEQYVAYFLDPKIQENIRSGKEEQFQEGFLRELFVNVLGYKLFPDPDYNLITEQKNETDAQKADGAILVNEEVRAVIELKSTKTIRLKQVEKQAFDYKVHHKNASYVIISNFERLRFYVDNAVTYEEWNLFTLTEEQFAVLWLCLAYDNIVFDLPRTLKQESISREEKITNDFFAHYSQFKEALFNDLVANNHPRLDKLTLFVYAQKLLDRLIFLLFAEHWGLIPPNTVAKMINNWEYSKDEIDDDRPLYFYLKKHFSYLDKGHRNRKREIFGYNGGLFKQDDELDNLIVSDEVLRQRILNLCQYDYKSDVDVNILGHIFEHSLTEIEEKKYELSGGESYVLPPEGKRKQDGIFYTPRYITAYIIEHSLGTLCTEKKNELGIAGNDEWEAGSFAKHEPIFTVFDSIFSPALKKREDAMKRLETLKKKTKNPLIAKIDEYRTWLLSLTVCDPACGSGAFLNAALDFLIQEHRFLDEQTAQILKCDIVYFEHEREILENNLFGVDINEDSLEITQLALWLRTARRNRKLGSLDSNIKCGNSLISPTGGGSYNPRLFEKAFDWQKEFPHVFANGGFDAVIGNPPYVFARGGKFSEQEKEYYHAHYPLANYQLNTYLLFIDRAYHHLLHENSKFGFIVPNNCLTIDSFKPFRQFLLEKVGNVGVVNIFGSVFEDAVVDNCILTFSKTEPNEITLGEWQGEKLKMVGTFPPQDLAHDQYIINISTMKNPEVVTLLQKIENQSHPLETLSLVKSGLQAYEVGKGNPIQTAEMKENRGYHSKKQKSSDYYQYLDGRDVCRYFLNWGGAWLKYGSHLAAPRDKRIFVEPRILVRQIPSKPPYCIHAVYTEETILNDRNSNNILDFKLDPLYLLGILNSRLISFWFVHKFDKFQRGIFPQFKVKELALFPIPPCKKAKPFISLVKKMLEFKSDLQTRRARFLRRVGNNFPHFRTTEVLEQFEELTFRQFLAELKKQKINVYFNKQDKLERYFIEYQMECRDTLKLILKTDTKIDQLVYEFYGLTKDEIKMIEPDNADV